MLRCRKLINICDGTSVKWTNDKEWETRASVSWKQDQQDRFTRCHTSSMEHMRHGIRKIELLLQTCISEYSQLPLNGHLIKADTSLKWTHGVGPCHTSVTYFISLQGRHLSKADSWSWSRACQLDCILICHMSYVICHWLIIVEFVTQRHVGNCCISFMNMMYIHTKHYLGRELQEDSGRSWLAAQSIQTNIIFLEQDVFK